MADTPASSTLTLRAVTPGDAPALAELFAALASNGDAPFFEPHPLTAAEAERVARYSGLDIYVIVAEAGSVLGYGMLRGWDEGYAIPSLGIAIHPAARGSRLGRLLMQYLHALARRRGAEQVRLRVHTANTRAATLYRSLGYVFETAQADYTVGFLTLSTAE